MRLGPRARGIQDRVVISEINGVFIFNDVNPGSHWLSASHPSYYGGGYSMRSPEDSQARFDVLQGETVNDVVLRLWRAGVIAGRVEDPNGDPSVEAGVVALRRELIRGQARFTVNKSTRTDDRGEYRFFGLMPGEYLVAASSSEVGLSSQSVGSPRLPEESARTYFGGTNKVSQAAAIVLGSDEERSGVNVALKPRPTKTVFGRLVGLRDDTAVQLLDAESADLTGEVGRSVLTDAEGRFVFRGVDPGDYLIRVLEFPLPTNLSGVRTISVTDFRVGVSYIPGRKPSALPTVPAGKTFWFEMPIRVEDKDVRLPDTGVREGYEVSGHLKFENGPVPIELQDLLPSTAIVAVPADGRPVRNYPLTGIERNGSFRIAGLPPGPYELLFQPPIPGWHLEMVDGAARGRMTGIDITENGPNTVVVSMSTRRTRLSGTVRSTAPRSVAIGSVYVFPVDERLWRWPMQTVSSETRPSRLGFYEFEGLAPGDYYLHAVLGDAPLSWRSYEVLKRLAASAVKVHLDPGRDLRQDLNASVRHPD